MRTVFLLISIFILSFQVTANSKKEEQERVKKMQEEIRNIEKMFDRVFDDQFFKGKNDPFSNMKNFRNELRKMFNDIPGGVGGNEFDSFFKDWFGGRFGADLDDIKIREDDKFIYYELLIPNIQEQEIDISVEKGVVTIKSKRSEKYKNSVKKPKSLQTFNGSFSLPANVDSKEMETEIKGNNLIIKIKKIKEKNYRKKIKIKGGVSV